MRFLLRLASMTDSTQLLLILAAGFVLAGLIFAGISIYERIEKLKLALRASAMERIRYQHAYETCRLDDCTCDVNEWLNVDPLCIPHQGLVIAQYFGCLPVSLQSPMRGRCLKEYRE